MAQSSQIQKDAQEYKKFADNGMDLMFPARIQGRNERPDIQVPYHITIMLFDTDHDTPEQVHEIAKNLHLQPPDPRKVTLEFTTEQGRTGYTIYTILLHGPQTDAIEHHFNKFSHMGYKKGYKFHAHISMDHETWDFLRQYNGKTAFDAGIEFLPAELRKGPKLIANYKPKYPSDWGKEIQAEDKMLGKSELDIEVMRDTMWFVNKFTNSYILSLPAEVLKNYIQDNPLIKNEILKTHEQRVTVHFNGSPEAASVARKEGIEKGYEFLKKGK